MAIQNFLSGGFYGKLGDVVGQRWHNKRTIRTHVIPANPRTPKQQSNRQLFARATKLAQLAFNINKGHAAWHSLTQGEFSQRVSTAKLRLQRGASDPEALPLYPDGYEVSVELTNPVISFSSWYTSFSISVPSYTFTETRQMEIIISSRDEMEGTLFNFIDVITVSSGSTLSYSWTRPNNLSLPAGSQITAASLNDIQHGGFSIFLPATPITQPSNPVIDVPLVFDSFIIDDPDQWAHFDVSGFPSYGEWDPICEIYIYDPVGLKWITTGWFFYTENDPIGRIEFEKDPSVSYPVGSHVIAGNFTEPKDSANFKFSWPKANFNY